jgi:hypothetical protein
MSAALETSRRIGLESVLMGRTVDVALEGRTPYLLLLILLMTIPVAAIFLRMAALVAARSLFAAIFAAFSVACAGFAIAYLATLELRIILLLRELGTLNAAAAERSVLSKSLLELQHAGFYAFGFFISIALLSLRPYFRIQASRTVSAMVFLPAPFFVWSVIEDVAGGGQRLSSTPAMMFWTLIAVLFVAISVHSFRHRHLFIEVTNLRELLDTRAHHREGTPRRGLPIKGVAFDS